MGTWTGSLDAAFLSKLPGLQGWVNCRRRLALAGERLRLQLEEWTLQGDGPECQSIEA